MDIFGVPEDEFFNANKIKIFVGIAGAAKSSAVHYAFESKGISYLRAVPTHKLRIDAEKRFCTKCATIASALFEHRGNVFYTEYKEVPYEHVVIDEILQSSHKTIDWCVDNIGNHNIIITTDERQMLSVGEDDIIIKKFNELKNREECIVVELTETKRAIDAETKVMYKKLYELALDEKQVFEDMKRMFRHIKFSEMKYNYEDVFICHKNELEKKIYNNFDLRTEYDAPLIPKGNLSGKEVENYEKYSIVPQSDVRRQSNSYLQIANIATPTRFQGSEVEENQHLYYLIDERSQISNREFYTVLTRCKSKKSLVIVECEVGKTLYHEFLGLPIVDALIWSVENLELPGGRMLRDMVDNREGKALLLSDEDIAYIASKIPEKENIYYDNSFFFCNGVLVRNGAGVEQEEQKNKASKALMTIQSLINKEQTLRLSYTEEVYQMIQDKLRIPRAFSNGRIDEFEYELDLYSAYPHVLSNCKIPVDGRIYEEYSEERLNFYYYNFNEFQPDVLVDNCLISEELYNVIKDFPEQNVKFAFSVPCKKGCQTGFRCLNDSLKTELKKKQVKEIRWGYMAKSLYEGHWDESGTKYDYYIRRKENNMELQIINIHSNLVALMLQLRHIIYGNYYDGKIITDAIHFNCEENIINLVINFMSTAYNNYRYRIKRKGEIIYKNYEEPKTTKELRSEQNKRAYQKRKEREENEKREKESISNDVQRTAEVSSMYPWINMADVSFPWDL